MASTGHFQLFPPPPPRVSMNNSNTNPFRKATKKHVTRPRPSSLAEEDIVKRSSQAEAVVIHIIEDSSIQRPPVAHVIDVRTRTPSPEPKAPQKNVPAPLTIKTSTTKNASPIEQSARSGSATLVRTPSVKSKPGSPRSPVIAMRSMFPRYDPSVPLNRQQYYPPRGASPTNIPMQSIQRGEYSPHAMSPSRLDEVLGGPKTAPASVIDFPVDALSPQGPKLSTPIELSALWESANGQGPQATLGTFDMEMSRTEPATFVFGSSAQQPFYTLQTYDTNELAITRTHPLKAKIQVPILLLALEPEERRHAPSDGLVSFIFPKLAAMLAIDQSNELAKHHQLAPTVRDEMQADAVKRAAAQESSRLVWREDCRRYELAHPAIGKSIHRSPRIGTPVSPVTQEWGILHITVSSHALSSPYGTAASPPVILVTNPNPTSETVAHAPATPRTSTLPISESDEPLASLDLGSMSLKISAGLITTMLPSLYAIDSVVAAMMAVAVSDEATNPIMAEMPIWTPRRHGLVPPPAPASVFGGASVAGSYNGDLFATLAEREEAEQEAQMMSQLKKSKSTASKKSTKTSKKGKKQSEPKQIVIGEFDLEKYGHYQAGDREGEKLPGVTRTTIKALYITLKFVVWGLTVMVQILTWLLVNVTRAVTSEKF